MSAKKSTWALYILVCLGLEIIVGCNTQGHSAKAAKPAGEIQPLFTPVTASLAQQKMCDEQATKKFNENKHGAYDSYTSHYDPVVNVCFVRVDSIAASPLITTAVVYDAFGGHIYANYVWINSQHKKAWDVPPSTCEFQIPGKPIEKCNSEEQFDELTEKYFGVTP